MLGIAVVLWLLASTSRRDFGVLGGMVLLATLYYIGFKRHNRRIAIDA
jgi:hypothetical protein